MIGRTGKGRRRGWRTGAGEESNIQQEHEANRTNDSWNKNWKKKEMITKNS